MATTASDMKQAMCGMGCSPFFSCACFATPANKANQIEYFYSLL
jgi:hypothetical protein